MIKVYKSIRNYLIQKKEDISLFFLIIFFLNIVLLVICRLLLDL